MSPKSFFYVLIAIFIVSLTANLYFNLPIITYVLILAIIYIPLAIIFYKKRGVAQATTPKNIQAQVSRKEITEMGDITTLGMLSSILIAIGWVLVILGIPGTGFGAASLAAESSPGLIFIPLAAIIVGAILIGLGRMIAKKQLKD